MNFHNTREEYDRIAVWLEENDVEIDWDELRRSPWWVGPDDWVPPPKWSMPKRVYGLQLTPQMVTNLLLAQGNGGLEIPFWVTKGGESLENGGLGGEGVEPRPAAGAATGHSRWENFLEVLSRVRVVRVEVRPISEEERRLIGRQVRMEEELERWKRERNVWRVMRQSRGEAERRVRRMGEKRLRGMAARCSEVALVELERRGLMSEEEVGLRRERREELGKRAQAGMKESRERVKREVAEREVALNPKEVELEVVRVAPNPRIIRCWYEVGGERREVLVKVRSNANFRKGMRFVMEVPGGLDWEYGGELPRRAGGW